MGMTSHPQPVMGMTCHPKVGDRVGLATEYTFLSFFFWLFFGLVSSKWMAGIETIRIAGDLYGWNLGIIPPMSTMNYDTLKLFIRIWEISSRWL
jgi:hypothetical protein